jgi:glutathione-specific gamma-glutamylcyclotransferase
MANMQQFWVFGYGSLMWNPGFDFYRSEPALIHGFHRSLCVYSFIHRGTPERPGLVLGLDYGGSCHGMAFRVAPEKWGATLAYLRAREQVTSVYLEAMRPVRLLMSGKKVAAVAFVVDRSHRQYAGKLDTDRLLKFIRQGRGQSGHCSDYVLSTLAHLRAMDIHDAGLEALASQLQSQAASLTG